MHAKENVKLFLDDSCRKKDKLEWEKISTVFQFHRDKKNIALYSQLHEWAEEEKKMKKKEKNNKKEDENNLEPTLTGRNDLEMTKIGPAAVNA